MPEFYNYMTGQMANVATEQRGDRWYILMGFAGFNSRLNNAQGYATKAAAEAAIRHYQKVVSK